MSEQTQVERRRLSIVAAGRRHDVVVDARARLGDVLDQLGVAADSEGLTPDGTRLSRGMTLAAQQTPDGVVLTVVDGDGVTPARVRSGARSAAHAPGSRRGPATTDPAPEVPSPAAEPDPHPRDRATRATDVRPRLVPALALVLPVLVAASIVLAGATGAAVVAGGVLLAGALVVAWSGTGVGVRTAAVLGGSVGAGLLVLGLTAGVPAGAGHLTVAGGGLGAALCAVLGRHTDPLVRQTGRTVVTVGLLTALGAVLALVASVPVTVLAVVAAGLAVVLARILPDVVMGGDDASPIDLDRLATTAWSPRPRPARRRAGPVLRAELEGRVQVAALHQRFVLAGILAALLVASLTLVVSRPGSVLATTVALGATGAGLGLVARRYHARVDRWLLRVAGLAALTAAWVLGTGSLPAGPAIGVTAGVLAISALLVVLAPAVGRGWTSLALGRVADLLEGLCVAAALPLAAWAAGLVPWLRNLMA